eukprot:gene1444-32818_t
MASNLHDTTTSLADLSLRQTGGQPSTAVSPLIDNLFAKFATIEDAIPLWRQAAEELANYAAMVTCEGGLEAAFVAPFIYSSLDALAARARRWTMNRAELLEQRGLLKVPTGSEMSSSGSGSLAEMMGAAAELFTAAVHEEVDKTPEPQEEFPALGPSSSQLQQQQSPSQQQPQQNKSLRAQQKQKPAQPDGGGEFGFETAFSDEEGASETALPSATSSTYDLPPGEVAESPMPSKVGRPGQDIPGQPPTRSFDPKTGHFASLEGTSPDAESPLGCSPTSLMLLNTTNARQEYFSYQATDGQWVFLDPLSLRCLLHHYGSYEACPPQIEVSVLEAEDVTQAQVDLSKLLPAKSLEPFAEELAQRERYRKRKVAETRKEKQREAAADKAQRKARVGPSLQELNAMPALGPSPDSGIMIGASLGSDADLNMAMANAVEEEIASAGSTSVEGTPSSFAHLVKLGYAATGPSLGVPAYNQDPPLVPWGAKSGPAPASASPGAVAWGAPKSAAGPSAATQASGSVGGGKKGKKGVVLFSSGAQRRY